MASCRAKLPQGRARACTANSIPSPALSCSLTTSPDPSLQPWKRPTLCPTRASSEQGERGSLLRFSTKAITNQSEKGHEASHQGHRLETPSVPVRGGEMLTPGQPPARGSSSACGRARSQPGLTLNPRRRWLLVLPAAPVVQTQPRRWHLGRTQYLNWQQNQPEMPSWGWEQDGPFPPGAQHPSSNTA